MYPIHHITTIYKNWNIKVELSVEKVFIRSQSWWKLVTTNNFRTEQQEKSWKMLEGKRTISHNKGIQEVTFFVLTLEGKMSVNFPLLNSTNVYLEKAWRPTWNYKTLLRLVGVSNKAIITQQLRSFTLLFMSESNLPQILAHIHVLSVRKVVYWCRVLYSMSSCF